ncbi:hypothetical protein BASA50_000064 [Batrachochytrium salamandrivorans]|uniref:GH26 domain-containing protein n=1 Tax=Batrachochytrium salamandrivorans TaxID=1357716 RepID=A0ABQ8EVG7_9FUNG|nr:hypothetical protein BASA62_007021 [Batrachochytrium salamandrivorans]KAH6587017.1 hypothetical protein BASA50_000064 [Batrachochytrium salamandrivorans]KAH6601259.1 hypothetical protein BASA61_002029 [Batrachochytrium salamandrivorans]KAJ1344814.1 hypothetical protein BSLG_000329 [Batrachochytrium salamandrivorans]
MARGDPDNSRRVFCACLFWSKCLLATLLAVGGLGGMIYKIYTIHATAYYNEPVLKPTIIDRDHCQYEGPLARLEPPSGRLLVGFHLDWALQVPKDVREIIGFAPAVINAFMMLDPTANEPMDYNLLTWHVWQVSLTGGMFGLTIQPSMIDNTPMEILDRFAQALRDLNAKYGVPILLRYGHEMNGDWTKYGYQPTAYRSGFIKMAKLVRQYTNMTAMVWGPNLGVTYPFLTSEAVVKMPTMQTNPADFRLLDTNHDGKVDSFDDPYDPYYPGDEWVDWVAISLYYYPDSNTGYNGIPPANYFRDNLHGSGENIPNINPLILNDNGLHDFYTRFVKDKNKPLMIPETSAPYISSQPANSPEVDIKRNWWNQIYDYAKDHPMLKAAVFFEELKVDDEVRDWRMLANSTVRPAFISDYNARGKELVHGLEIKFHCSGKVDFV